VSSFPRSALAGLGRHPARLSTVLVVIIGILLPFWVDAYWLSTLVFVLVAALGALGLDVLTGRTGQISLGHAFFLMVGAYTGGYLGVNLHESALFWIPAAGIVAGLLGAVAATTAMRLRGLYLGIVTIGLVYIGQWVATNWTTVSGGSGGRTLAVPGNGTFSFANGLHLGSLSITENGLYYYTAFVLLALGMMYVHNLGHSRVGRNMAAVRDRELAAAVLGVNVARTKTTAFIVSSIMAGVAGAMYGSFLSFVTPGQFDLLLSIQYVIIVVVGGLGALWGPLLGAFFVVGLPALLQNEAASLPFLEGGTRTTGIPVTDATDLLYGVLLIVFLLVEPRGIVGLAHRIGSLVRRRRATPKELGVVPSLTQEG
jgi:branched-chain amino acid transport system permease protein